MISIIIPMYNAEKTIVRCLDSIIKQKFTIQIEILVVNDGSKDNSGYLVQEYINKNKTHQIHLLNKENGGASSARNEGITFAKGEYILFLDSDDTFVKNSIFYISKIIDSYDFDIACFGFEFFDDKNKSLLKFKYNKIEIKDFINDFLINGTVKNVIWNKIYSHNFLSNNKIKFHSNFEPNEDSLFVFEILLKTNNIIFLDKILYNHISDNKDSYTNKFHNFHYVNAISLLGYYKEIITLKLNDSYFKSYYIFCIRVLCRLILVSSFSTPERLDFHDNLKTIYLSEIWKSLLKSKDVSFKYKCVLLFFNTPSFIWHLVQILKKVNFKIQ